MSSRNSSVSKGVDWTVVVLYAILVAIGILCIFMVEYRSGTNWMQLFLGGKTNYSKQVIFAGFCTLVAAFILMADSKLFTAFANLAYAFGILLMIATFVIGKDIKGSRSWIAMGGGFQSSTCRTLQNLCVIGPGQIPQHAEHRLFQTQITIDSGSHCSIASSLVQTTT